MTPKQIEKAVRYAKKKHKVRSFGEFDLPTDEASEKRVNAATRELRGWGILDFSEWSLPFVRASRGTLVWWKPRGCSSVFAWEGR